MGQAGFIISYLKLSNVIDEIYKSKHIFIHLEVLFLLNKHIIHISVVYYIHKLSEICFYTILSKNKYAKKVEPVYVLVKQHSL